MEEKGVTGKGIEREQRYWDIIWNEGERGRVREKELYYLVKNQI